MNTGTVLPAIMGDEGNNSVIPVRVAVRIRPCSDKELREGCVSALDKVQGRPQVYFRSSKDKAFTYDFVYDSVSGQSQVFNEAVQPLIAKLFKGVPALKRMDPDKFGSIFS